MLTAAEIDLIIVATTTPDMIFPAPPAFCRISLARGIARRSTCRRYAAVSFTLWLRPICIFAPVNARTALVVGTEIYSRILDWTDRSTCVLFGDGAGAVVLTRSAEPGIVSSHLHADGSYSNILAAPGNFCGGKAKVLRS